MIWGNEEYKAKGLWQNCSGAFAARFEDPCLEVSHLESLCFLSIGKAASFLRELSESSCLSFTTAVVPPEPFLVQLPGRSPPLELPLELVLEALLL